MEIVSDDERLEEDGNHKKSAKNVEKKK